MKKIFSLILAIAMMSIGASSVFAAVSTADEGGNTLVVKSSVPTEAYYATVTPVVDVTATQLTTKEEVKAESTTAFSNSANVTNYDVYKIDVELTNLGELVNGFDTDWESVKAGIYGVKVVFPTQAFTKSYINAAQIAGGTATVAQDTLDDTKFNLVWAAAALSNPYPVFDENVDPIVPQYQANGTMTLTFLAGVTKGSNLNISDIEAAVTYTNSITGVNYDNNNAASKSLALPPAPATVDVESVTISGATAATVGDNVQLSATVLPDNATDKTVTWTKVSGNGAVSDSGVVTATAAGDVVVKATAGGVDSANYTVSFAAAVPADIVPAASDKDTYSNASTGLKDAFGKDVTIDSSRSYGAAKFDNVVLDDGEYVYKVFATGTNKATGLEETKSWDVVDGSVELTGASVSFIAIVRSATHTITSVVLKAFAK